MEHEPPRRPLRKRNAASGDGWVIEEVHPLVPVWSQDAIEVIAAPLLLYLPGQFLFMRGVSAVGVHSSGSRLHWKCFLANESRDSRYWCLDSAVNNSS
jgi:hypothetical protein